MFKLCLVDKNNFRAEINKNKMSKLSNTSRERFAKAVTVFTSVATVLSLSGVMYLAPVASAAVPSDYGLKEGWTISAAGSSDPDIYIVNEQGYKRLFLNPAIFNFYGHLGGFAAVHNVTSAARDAFPTSGLFRNCETNDQKVYGVETTGEDTGMLHWVNTTGAQAVADDPNFFSKVFCINNNEFSWYSKGSDYTSVSQVPNYTRGTIPTTTGPLSASLASDNPVAGTLVATQALADLAHFNVMGSGTVTDVELKRIGVSSDTTLSAVYLFVNGVRVSDSGNVSNGVVTFNNANGLFTAPAVVSVRSNILTGTSGQTVGVQLTKLNTSTVAVSGNVHSIATVSNLATVALGTANTVGAFDPGKDINLWQSNFTVGTEDVYLKRLTVREIGSINNTDITNLRLFVDGIQVATAAGLNSDGYGTFLMNQRMLQGTRTVKVVADVIGGSTRTIQLQVKGAYDVDVMDEVVMVNVVPTGTFAVGSAAATIGNPSVTVVRATDSPSSDVVNDAKNVRLAKYTMTGYGEAIKIETMEFVLTAVDTTGDGTIDGLDNGRVLINGQQYGSTTDLLITDGTEYTVNYTLQPGVATTVEVYADIQDSTGDHLDATDTVVIAFNAGDNNYGQGVTSATSVDIPHSSTDVDGLTITVATGSMTAGKYTGYANQTIVAPKSAFKFGHFTLTAASSEDVNVNTVDITGADVSGSDWNEADITDMYIKVWNDAGAVVYTSSIKSTVSATASNSYSTSFTLPKNKVYQVEVWGNISSTDATNGDAFRLELDASGITVDSGSTADLSRATGQTVTSQSGALTVANGSLPVAKFVNGATTKNLYNFTLTPTYDDFTVDEIYVDILTPTTASNSGAVANVILKDGSATLQTAVIDATTGSASFTGLNLALPQSGGTKTLSVDVQFSNVGVGANDTGGNVTLYLDGLKYRAGSGGSATTTKGLSTSTYAANAHYLVKGYPTFTNAVLPTTVLAGGTQTLFKTVVSATGGQIAWNNVTFTVSSNSAAGIFGAAADWKLFENGVDVTPSDTGAVASVSDIGTTTRVQFEFATERVISSGNSVTLELKTTVSGTLAANDSVTSKLLEGLGTTVSTEDSTTQAAKNTSFVWTDQSAPSHSTTTDDWFTDGLVKTLADSQTLTK